MTFRSCITLLRFPDLTLSLGYSSETVGVEGHFSQWCWRRIKGGQEEGSKVAGYSITWAVSAKGYRRESCIKYATVQIRMQGGGTGMGGSQIFFSFHVMAAPFPLRPTCFDSFPFSLLADIFSWPFLRCLTSFTPPFLAVQPPQVGFWQAASATSLLGRSTAASEADELLWISLLVSRQSRAQWPESLSCWDHPFIWRHLCK